MGPPLLRLNQTLVVCGRPRFFFGKCDRAYTARAYVVSRAPHIARALSIRPRKLSTQEVFVSTAIALVAATSASAADDGENGHRGGSMADAVV